MNLVEGILQQRDRLLTLRADCGELWNEPGMVFYRQQWQQLVDLAAAAIGGKMETLDMIRLYKELQEFEA